MKTQPFTYIIKFKPTNQWYYGVRWARGCSPKDLWNTYFTSSKHIKFLIKNYGKDSFDVRISKVFDTKEQAINHERRFLLKVKAASNGGFINKRNNMPEFDSTGLKVIHHIEKQIETWHDPNLPIPIGWCYGVSNKHRLNNTKSQLGKTAWNKGKKLPSTGPCSDSRKQNIKNSRILTKKLQCSHCNKFADPGNYKRFHGERCKYNLCVDKSYWEEISKKAKKSTLKQIEEGKFNNFGRKSEVPDILPQSSNLYDQ
jgi:hypothetical protein